MITMGVLSAPISDQAQMLRKQGLRFKDIAWEMAVSIDTVSSRLPYEDEIHGSDDASDHTQSPCGSIGLILAARRICQLSSEAAAYAELATIHQRQILCASRI